MFHLRDMVEFSISVGIGVALGLLMVKGIAALVIWCLYQSF